MPCDAMRDAGLRRIGSRLDVGEKGCRVRPHRRQFGARVAADPQAEVGRRRSGAPVRRTADSRALREGFRRFRRAVAARSDERVAVGDVQLRQSLVAARLRLDLFVARARPAAPAPRRVSGIAGVGEEAFERGREDGVGVGGSRAVDW